MVGLGSINQKNTSVSRKINGNLVLRCPLGVHFRLDVRFFSPEVSQVNATMWVLYSFRMPW